VNWEAVHSKVGALAVKLAGWLPCSSLKAEL
jgi:hypothetical protein